MVDHRMQQWVARSKQVRPDQVAAIVVGVRVDGFTVEGDPLVAGQNRTTCLTPLPEHGRLAPEPLVLGGQTYEPRPNPAPAELAVTRASSGTVLDNVKGRTADDGIALFELLPGRNYLSLRRKGCPKQDERIDVEPGGGIDGFKLVLTCAKR